MTTRPGAIKMRPWEWRADDANPVPGFMISSGRSRGAFIPFTEAHNIADQIIDYAEQHERKEQQQ